VASGRVLGKRGSGAAFILQEILHLVESRVAWSKEGGESNGTGPRSAIYTGIAPRRGLQRGTEISPGTRRNQMGPAEKRAKSS